MGYFHGTPFGKNMKFFEVHTNQRRILKDGKWEEFRGIEVSLPECHGTGITTYEKLFQINDFLVNPANSDVLEPTKKDNGELKKFYSKQTHIFVQVWLRNEIKDE